MKLTVFLLPLAAATPLIPRNGDASDTATDIDAILSSASPCASTAIIFARGTFDSGNLGVWVGPFLRSALHSVFGPDVAVQGINPADYPAVLDDYVGGGSQSCAVACARLVEGYAAKCAGSNIFVSGWSQGALCAHKCVNLVPNAPTTLTGLTVFGSENALMDVPQPLPPHLPFRPYCNTNTTAPDVLCTATALSGFRIPSTIAEWKTEVGAQLALLGGVAEDAAQREAAVRIPGQLVAGVAGVVGDFTRDVVGGRARRWMVLPAHFVYGNNGMAGEAAKWMKEVVDARKGQ